MSQQIAKVLCEGELSIPYYNRGLFSEHYLLHRLPQHPVWQEDVHPVFSQILSLYQQKKQILSTYNERQTEEEFIQPLFEILGFVYTSQIRFKRHEQVSIPDYALFTSEESKRDAEDTRQSRDELHETAFFKHVAALAEAKYWARTLDVRASDNRDNSESRGRNPHFQITRYLSDSGVRWGILTNGTHWRLYFSGIESQEILYYEVELKRVLEEENENDFRYFYHFFRAAAFEPDSEGRIFLDEVFEQSRSYAKQVEDRLKERIFEQVVPVLACGFLAYRRNELNISQETKESLEEFFDGTLLFLYRLIFLLYAEARNLLPVNERQGYFAYSLTKLKQTIFEEQKTGRKLSNVSTNWYNDLSSLFTIIHKGDTSLNVPRYNGGLFAPDGLGDPYLQRAAKFLENHAIPDSYLAEALMFLTCDLDKTEELMDARFIDYRDLNVRHLGSIYEGLLEFKLKIAEQPLVKAREKGKDVYKPISNDKQAKTGADVQTGEIYLTNDKSERKATGSYYTPDYIVQYIVENSVGPLIEQVVKECKLAQEIRNESRSLNEIFEELIDGKTDKEQKKQRELWKLTRDDAERHQFLLNMLNGAQPWHDYDVPTRILELKILDPAIGSGHFLVGAMDFITRKMVGLLEQFPNSPLLKEIEETRKKILAEAERRDVRIDAKLLEDENLLRRMVMKRCLYGVDLNPMAVELAKLSLWLHGFTVGAPLSFLDHHIKCGNSLIGSTNVKQSIIKSTKKYQDFLRAVNNYFIVVSLADATYSEVEQSYKLHEEAKSWLEPTKERLNVNIAVHFMKLDRQSVANAQKWAEEDNRVAKDEHDEISLENFHKAQQIAEEKRFFHWPIEFPDAFFERREGTLHRDTAPIEERENPGFDAVIGNPPYTQLSMDKHLDSNLKSYLLTTYESSMGRLNTFGFFLKLGIELIRNFGYEGMIIPNTILTMTYYTQLREMILNACRVKHILIFDNVPFEDAVIENVVLIMQAESDIKERLRNSIEVDYLTTDSLQRTTSHDIPQNAFMKWHENIFNPYLTANVLDIRNQLQTDAKLLGELVYVNQGIALKHDRDKWLFDEQKGSDFKPVLDGRDISRYHISFPDTYLYYDLNAIHSCKREDIFLTDEKLLFRRVSDSIITCYDDRQFYALNTLVVINLKMEVILLSLKFLLTLMNSKLLNWYYVTFLKSTKDVFSEIQARQIERIPIRRIFFTTSKDEREPKVTELKSLYEDSYYDTILRHIDELLPKDEEGNFIAFKHSISVKDAIAKGYITKQDAEKSALENDDPSGDDENGNPLEKSDVVHDFLAFLAEQMTDMNTDKYQQIQYFWTDLEGITDDDTFEKLQKGKQERTLARKETLSPFVDSESASVKHLDDSLEWTEKAFKEFAKSLAGRIPNLSDILEIYNKYTPTVQALAQRIQATDELIDGVVYRLYGVTEKEIAVIEKED